jgi:Tripartite tricarboxylate transporter family receptor
MHRRSLMGAATSAALLPAVSRAQAFPSKQLRLIVGFAAGGGGDIVARVLAAELTKSNGYSVLVDNKPGAGGNIATREALRAPPDGHTILFANVGMLAVNPYAMKDVGYDPTTDIAPVCLAVDFSNVLVVHPSVPAKTLAEYLELAKRPEGMDYGSSGVGGAGHLAGELLKARSGVKLNHIPFRGGGPAMNDLVAHPRACRHRGQALSVRSRHPDHRRAGLSGLRRHQLVRHRGVVQGPARDRGRAEHDPDQGAEGARGAGGLRPAGHGDDRRHPGRSGGPHRPRDRDLEESHRRCRHSPGVTRVVLWLKRTPD